MKKILLVDDEIVFRETIRDSIDWRTEGFMYCGDAPDGEVALPLIEQLLPDILSRPESGNGSARNPARPRLPAISC
ncbi:hypothetical protein [Paenibacillus mesotrionivorans]|uniref:Uncharacterized protein n=1 Tax=Paenibacillus mesotrionivorans TaxID=3160968 RepID=A0ACC7P1Y2_9BACL